MERDPLNDHKVKRDPTRRHRLTGASAPSLKRALAHALVALLLVGALAGALSGCSLSLRPSSDQTSSTTTVASGTGETRSTTTTAPPKKVTTTTRAPSTTTSSTTSTTLRATTTTAGATAVHATTGDQKAIAKKVSPSCVRVTATWTTNVTKQSYYVHYSWGTGVVYSATASSAYIVTCNHVIQRDDGKAARTIKVTLPSGSTVTATLVGRDPVSDIAVLKVKARKLTPAVFRTDLSQLEEGDFVVAIGKVKQLKHPVVSGNFIRWAHDVTFPDLPSIKVDPAIWSSAPLEEGDSGGPLIDALAQVIGLNMGRPEEGEGAISAPADLVVEVADGLIAAAK
jgi:S1-C subfamily serine protease